jgi:predicted lipoprotein with Yx(FWY)xxD motif
MRVKNIATLALTLAFAIGFFAIAEASDTEYVKSAYNNTHGTILTGTNGMTLYTFAKDTENTSACYGDCAQKWPPLLVSDKYSFDNMGGKLGIAKRTDGTYQVTAEGKPLYFWFKDMKPGDTTGHEVKNVWFVAK